MPFRINDDGSVEEVPNEIERCYREVMKGIRQRSEESAPVVEDTKTPAMVAMTRRWDEGQHEWHYGI